MLQGYHVTEIRNLLEHDSPVPGCLTDLVSERLKFGYFKTKSAALFVRDCLQKEHQRTNPTLQYQERFPEQKWLIGTQEHPFAHELQITHSLGREETIGHQVFVPHSGDLEHYLLYRERTSTLPFHLQWNKSGLNLGYIGELREWDLPPGSDQSDHKKDLLGLAGDFALLQSPVDINESLANLFTTPKQAREWLYTPLPDLDGMRPYDFVYSGDSRNVNLLLDLMRDGVG